MSAQKKRGRIKNRVTCDQIEILNSYMEEHSLFARGQITQLGCQGHLKYEQMWINLSTHLNNIGPCIKTVSSWQETWKSLRLAAKKRKATFLQAYNKTGHTDSTTYLSDHDERITSIFGKYGLGLNIIQEAGFCNFNYEESYSDITDKHLPYSIEPFNFDNSVLERNMLNEVLIFEEEVKSIANCSISRKPVVRPNQEQKSSMLQFMENHPEFAVNYLSNDDLWTELLQFLHGIGPVRSLKAWQKTWCDCIRAAEQSHQMSMTGIKDVMTDFHFRIFNLTAHARNVQSENSPMSTSTDYVKQFAVNEMTDEDVTTPMKVQKKNFASKPTQLPPIPITSSITSTKPRFIPVTTAAHSPVQTVSQFQSSRSPLTPATFSNRLNTSYTSAATASASTCTSTSGVAQRKAVTFMTAFKKSQEELIKNITDCFEKQNAIIEKAFQEQHNTLSILPVIIAKEVQQAINSSFEIQSCSNCNNLLSAMGNVDNKPENHDEQQELQAEENTSQDCETEEQDFPIEYLVMPIETEEMDEDLEDD